MKFSTIWSAFRVYCRVMIISDKTQKLLTISEVADVQLHKPSPTQPPQQVLSLRPSTKMGEAPRV